MDIKEIIGEVAAMAVIMINLIGWLFVLP